MLPNDSSKNRCKIPGDEMIQMTLDSLPKGTRSAKCYSTVGTLIYLLLLVPLLAVVFCRSLIAFESFSLWHAILQTIIYCVFLLSLPTSVFCMWRNYGKGYYNKTYIAGILPILVFLILWFVDICLDLATFVNQPA